MRGRVQDAEEGVAGLKTMDSQEADYWMAVVYAMKGNAPDGFKLANDFLEAVRRYVCACVVCACMCVCMCVCVHVRACVCVCV